MSSRRLQRTIENPTLELKIISANDVSYIDATEKMDVYAVVSIKGDNTQKKQTAKTPIDYDGGSNPTWNHTVRFSANEETAGSTLQVKLFSYWLEDEDDLYLGEVNVSVQELLASNPLANGNVDKMKLVTYPVKLNGETKPNAKLSFSHRFKQVPVKDMYPIYLNPDPMRSGQPQLQTPTVTRLALEMVIKFANDIKKVNILDEMKVYASVTIREGKKTIKHRTKTPIAFSAYQNPRWDHPVKFSLDEQLAQDCRLMLIVELMSHRPFLGDKQIGEVNVSIRELLSLNPPSPSTHGDGNDMMLVTQYVSGSYGKKGTLSFTYRFLTEQVTVPKPSPSVTPQPFIMYLPVSHQAYASPDSIHGTSDYVTVHPGAQVGPSNGLMPIYMESPYQTHGYQNYTPHQSQSQLQQYQLPPQKSEPRPQPQQPQPQALYDTQSHPYHSYGYQHYSSPEPLPQQQPQLPQVHTQLKRQGGSTTALGLGAAVLGRAIGGALLSDMMSDEVNMYYEV